MGDAEDLLQPGQHLGRILRLQAAHQQPITGVAHLRLRKISQPPLDIALEDALEIALIAPFQADFVVMDDENGGFRDGVGGDDHVGREMTVLWGRCWILDIGYWKTRKVPSK